VSEVIFSETQQASIKIHNKLRDYLNDSKRTVLRDLVSYHKEKDEWPTCRELKEYSDLPDRTLQPRLTKELREDHLVEKAGKRPCKQASHNQPVNTFKTTTEVTQ